MMIKNLVKKMQQNAAAFTTICMLLCFAFNYTFPLHRQTTNDGYTNSTQHWDNFFHHDFILDQTKKMANDMEDALRKIKNSAQKLVRSHGRGLKREMDSKLSEEDLRQYEQLVIMKKYPYLDLKELELKYSPLSNKNARSFILGSDVNFRGDNSLDPEEGLNVEIINRGLSGFTIPPKLAKSVAMLEGKLKLNALKVNQEKLESVLKKKSSKRETFEKYITDYEQKKNKALYN